MATKTIKKITNPTGIAGGKVNFFDSMAISHTDRVLIMSHPKKIKNFFISCPVLWATL
jgi:hypothetical protein